MTAAWSCLKFSPEGSYMKTAILMLALLLSTTQSCDSPASKGPSEPVAVNRLEILVETHPEHMLATIRLNAVDHAGLPTVDLESGQLYPTENVRRTPYGHVIVAPASAVVTYSVEVVITGEAGDLVGCSMKLNGEKLTTIGAANVADIPREGVQWAHVFCEYTWIGNR